jgi:hypothetical protein
VHQPFKKALVVLTLFTSLAFVKVSAQGTYSKIEASFNITNLTTDPFDYTVTDVRVQILQPDNSTVSLPAFFDGGTTWRVRHMPTMAGTYSISGITRNGSTIAVSNLQPTSWTVAGPPTGAGFIRVDPSNPRRFITSNGRRFFPRGEDVAWDVSPHNVTNIFWRMAAAHENWSRVWMDHWDGKNLDWPASGPTLPLGQLNLAVAQKWDGIVAAADQAGVHFQMTLQHHGQYSTTVDPNWGQNPYNVSNTIGSTNGFLTNAVQFFTNATAISLTERKMRYAVARWGYSPSIMAWELFNEVQFTDAGQTGQWGIVQTWHDLMATFIRSQDTVYKHLITTSSDLTEPIWDDVDYYTHHDYPSDVISGLQDATDITASQPVRPDYGSECATNGTPMLGVDAPLWAGLMAGQSGSEDPWWWDSMDAENDYIYFRAMSDFITRSGLGDQNTVNKSSPQVTGGADGPLAFAPGGGYADATQDTFVVGDAPPDGFGAAPSFLQGNYHRSMTPNGYTFQVNYPQAGTFSVQVLEIAASGAGLEIFLDGSLQSSNSFPAYGSDTSTNFTASIPVTAGAHSINIWNPGLDWLVLGNITLNPYAPGLSAYALGNTNFNATWVWNRTNVFNTAASATVSGTVQVAGLNPGTYLGTWWDTFGGVAISNFTFSVVSTNPATVNTPAILRSAALYVGPAPQASVTAPGLTQTLGTNSPAITLPVTIANGGGLPLGYSVVITNASPVNYGAVNSAQPGGPAFTWQDISSLGQEITSNFTQAVITKTAKDEGIAGPVNIGFAFPFFTNSFTQLYVSPNGFVTFTPFSGDTSTNTVLPKSTAPANMIAFFWTDMIIQTGTHVYTLTDPINGTFTLQFQNMVFKGTSSSNNCELVLKTTGEILMAYQSMALSNTCTVGVQNGDGTQGTTVAFDQNYLQSNSAVLLTPTPWFRFDGNAGYAPGSESNIVNVTMNPAGLAYGNYTATVLVQTTDSNQPLFSLPVSLTLAPIATWRQTYFGTAQNAGIAANSADPQNDGIVNILAYAFGLNPLLHNSDPISVSKSGNYLTLTFKRPHPAPTDISYLPQVAGSVTSGVWNSGPSYTTQTVTNNGDGTETVTVTDLTPIGSAQAHYMRVLISTQ